MLESNKDREIFGLVCKRWLHLQNTERRKLAARPEPHMLRKMTARFSRLIELEFSQSISRPFYPVVTDSELTVIADGFNKCLRVLKLQKCEGITDRGMLSIGCSLSSLQSLDVSYCRNLTDKGLSAVAEGCPDLRILYLTFCSFITDKLLRALWKNCPDLQELDLQGCTDITDNGDTDLVKGCQKIQFLYINICSSVGDIGISNLSKACSSYLKTLKLLGCCRVGDKSIISVARVLQQSQDPYNWWL